MTKKSKKRDVIIKANNNNNRSVKSFNKHNVIKYCHKRMKHSMLQQLGQGGEWTDGLEKTNF
ncbi:hypothetical protein DERP_003143 [Dermatophagoides pteronyssinus]|uniref:Uncharacterized protein n=1 Tax=Dermatophagoides pteronyssinus TaxID=6956 RepID=A0ABQ8JIM8_DERPT|nr:hypothetical protein DERP_003143 [Dermatophagoides pteronyssinus]